ncbi:argininosuccinate lyase [Elusimicrobium posterum]|uniref:argininosuccinate lyase n=1 Tax=Elusimicrobium posterum TaxID=3116653 RepID=UPI003C707C6B
MKKMWGGRFDKETNKVMEEFNASVNFDKRMYKQDITGSIAHAKMLAKCKIISQKDCQAIIKGLTSILKDIEAGKFTFKTELEDVHMNIEHELTRRIGAPGSRLHSARSRNDQVATDTHLYLKEQCAVVAELLQELMQQTLDCAQKNKELIIPGMTHLQHAQPILFAHHLMAYYCMFSRDFDRLLAAYNATDNCPLGAGAIAGTTLPIDRKMTAKELGFKNIYSNSMDAVSDRDYIVDFLAFASLLITHLSRLSEEIIIWSSSEFAYIELDDAYATGSSMMPQKKNPDAAELVRGKTGRIFGHLIGLLTTLKALPLTYNKDMQEDKEGLFDTIDNIKLTLKVFAGMIATLKVKKDGIERAFKTDYSNATDLADYLVKKGVPFRDAHEICGKTVAYAIAQKKNLQNLELTELQKISKHFAKDVFKAIELETCVNARNSLGGTSKKQVELQIKNAKADLAKKKNKIKTL